MKLKVALVGIGGMGKNHFNIYSKFDDIDFVAACDIRQERIDLAKETKSDMNFYTDFAEMLEKEKPDVVDVSTPTFLHAEHAIAALRSGAHVICEKPMALNSNETEMIIAEAKKAGKLFMSAHVVRFMKAYAYLAETIRSGKYGKLLKLDLRRIKDSIFLKLHIARIKALLNETAIQTTSVKLHRLAVEKIRNFLF